MKISWGGIGCNICALPGERLNQCAPSEVVSLLRKHGWVFFSGFKPSVTEFETFTSRFGTCQAVRTVPYLPGGTALGFHAEDAYTPFRPDTIWFLCVFEGSDGGVPTIVVDGVRLLKGMSEEWQRFSRRHQLRFERQWSANVWHEVVDRDDRGKLENVLGAIPNLTYQFLPDDTLYVRCDSPMVVRTNAGDDSFSNTFLSAVTDPDFYGMSLNDGSRIPEPFVSVVQKLALEGEMHVGWTAGDVVVVDNLRMMHRRGEYHGFDRDIRARHCENLFGSALPKAESPLAAWTKSLLQGDGAHTVRVGPIDSNQVEPFSELQRRNP
jgi:TfdA family taurine catabolism dioxygenase TauD